MPVGFGCGAAAADDASGFGLLAGFSAAGAPSPLSHLGARPAARGRARELVLTHFYPDCDGHDLRADRDGYGERLAFAGHLDAIKPQLTVAENIEFGLMTRERGAATRDRVLDLCAAPGGKTTHLAALTGNRARIVALDKSPTRVELIARGGKRLGCRGPGFRRSVPVAECDAGRGVDCEQRSR